MTNMMDLAERVESPMNACCYRDACRAAQSEIAALRARVEEVERERDAISEMGKGGAASLAQMMKAAFAKRGVKISDDEAHRAATMAADVVLYAALAGNPREWCLSCGTVSGDGQCHCTEPFAAAECNRKARNYTAEMAVEAQAADARANAAEAQVAALKEVLHWIAFAPEGGTGPTLTESIARARATLSQEQT